MDFDNEISEKLDLKGKILYFKWMLWIFLFIFIIFNFLLFAFFSWLTYFLSLIFGNVILFWVLVPLFMWIWKNYLIDKWLDIMEEAKTKKRDKKVVMVVEKD